MDETRSQVDENASAPRRIPAIERDCFREPVSQPLTFDEIIGNSSSLRVLEQAQMVAQSDASVLILGESGTGKELIASAIHAHSPRRKRPLVRINCGSIPAELFESEFFGHARGSFTGAVRHRVGRFQLAYGGTLFLDEVGEIPLVHQAKLLRVLQEGQFERVGEETTRKVNVRIIATTNRDLGSEVEARRFRQDLYYRLKVFPVLVPALRERKEDIPALAGHFIKLYDDRMNRQAELTGDDIDILKGYDWPGNVRELSNVIERGVILAQGKRLRLDLALRHGAAQPQNPVQETGLTVGKECAPGRGIMRYDELERLKCDNIIAALEQARWKISGAGGAAVLLGINHNTLASRMKAFGISRSWPGQSTRRSPQSRSG